EGDPALRPVVDSYVRRLGVGVVNAVNIFRPQLVLLGGGISQQGDILLEPIREAVHASCFGGEKGSLPEIAFAALGNRAGMIGAAALIYQGSRPSLRSGPQ
ncbi:ROK family protein, partial [uncultured Oscillibacter sp.]|uniref:ROK family protein n=1 Tax=uncultured Oscillibacter sp. TaxID=876091 RepID=UPI002605934B